MQQRLSPSTLYEKHGRLVNALTDLAEFPHNSALPASLLHLVKLRASQINNCGFCQHMHADEAREDGELQARLDVLPAWRELDCFSDAERVALEWTEALTLIHAQDVSDALYNTARDTFGEHNLIELTTVILQINSWNRISVSLRFQPDIKNREA